jgi:hypothetical protein
MRLTEGGDYGKWDILCDMVYVISHNYPDRKVEDNIYNFRFPCSLIFLQHNFTWQEANENCGKTGFKLISLNSLAKIACFKDLVGKFNETKREFWSSGLYLDCEETQTFRWCALGEDFSKNAVIWGKDQPPELKAGTCVSVVFERGKEPYFQASDCNSQISYICEVIFLESNSSRLF